MVLSVSIVAVVTKMLKVQDIYQLTIPCPGDFLSGRLAWAHKDTSTSLLP